MKDDQFAPSNALNGSRPIEQFPDNDRPLFQTGTSLVHELGFARGNVTEALVVTKGDFRRSFQRWYETQGAAEVSELPMADKIAAFREQRGESGVEYNARYDALRNVQLQAPASVTRGEDPGALPAVRRELPAVITAEITTDNVIYAASEAVQYRQGTEPEPLGHVNLQRGFQILNDLRTEQGFQAVPQSIMDLARLKNLKPVEAFSDNGDVLDSRTRVVKRGIAHTEFVDQTQITKRDVRDLFVKMVQQDAELAALPREEQVNVFNERRTSSGATAVEPSVLVMVRIPVPERIEISSDLITGEFGASAKPETITQAGLRQELDKFVVETFGDRSDKVDRCTALALYNDSRAERGLPAIPEQLLANIAA